MTGVPANDMGAPLACVAHVVGHFFLPLPRATIEGY